MPNLLAENPSIGAVAPDKRGDSVPVRNFFLPAVLIAAVVLCFFWPTFAGGIPVSKFAHLGEVDSLYNYAFKASNSWCGVDPSTYCLAIPVQTTVQRIWSSGHLPLWNPLNGCGYPMIADPQSFVFSPLYSLFPVSDWRLYNLLIVLKPLIGALGVLTIGILLRISPAASCFAALAYGLCPYFLRYEELPLQFSLIPWLFVPFMLLSRRQTLGRIAAAGAVCALFFSFTHPEPLFYGVVFASFLCIVQHLWINGVTARNVFKILAAIAAVATIAICLTAPVTLPFLEYVANGNCYKSVADNLSARPLSWLTVVLSLINPVFGGSSSAANNVNGVGSPFLGILLPVFLSLAVLTSADRRTIGLLILACVSFVCVTHLGPGALLDSKPFCYVMPVYCLPPLLLFISLLSAIGFERAVDSKSRLLCTCAWLAAALICLVLPGALALSGVPLAGNTLDGAMKIMEVDLPAWLTNSAAILAGTAVFFLRGHLRPAVVAALFIALNLTTQLCSAVEVLPQQQTFHPKLPGLLSRVKAERSRIVAAGTHLLMPNTNCLHELNDLAFDNPFTPAGYEKFISAAGATRRGLYMWDFAGRPTRMLDIASVRYLVSQGPLAAADESSLSYEPIAALTRAPLVVGPGLRLESGEMVYDPADDAVHGVLHWKVHARIGHTYVVEPVLTASDGAVVWSGTRRALIGKMRNQHMQEQDLEIAVNNRIAEGRTLIAGIRLWTLSNNQVPTVAVPQYTLIDTVRGIIPLLRFTKVRYPDADVEGRHLKLVGSDGQYLRLYENTRALPPVYVVHDALTVASRQAALDTLQNPEFDPRTTVVLECKVALPPGNRTGLDPGEVVRCDRPDANRVCISTRTNAPGLLVLTDTFYPGWTATLDGTQQTILRANFFFRAIRLPAGQHQITFEYNPLSFWSGVAVFFIAVLSLTLALLRGRRRKLFAEGSHD